MALNDPTDIRNAVSGDPDQLKSEVAGLGLDLTLGPTGSTESFLGDVADMEATNGKTGLLKGWKLPPGTSEHDFFALLSDAEKFASITGWKYFPTPQQLVSGLKAGLIGQGSDAIFAWLGRQAGVTQSMPWAAQGLDKATWQKKSGSINDIYEEATGNRLSDTDPLLQQAMNEHWTGEQFQMHLQKDPGLAKKYPYLAYGMDYQSWQTYKLKNHQELVERYGANPTDADYYNLLANPPEAFRAEGGPMHPGAKTPQDRAMAASQSAVR
jgi:hypothetical protein